MYNKHHLIDKQLHLNLSCSFYTNIDRNVLSLSMREYGLLQQLNSAELDEKHYYFIGSENLGQTAANPGGFLVQRSIRGRAAEMGCKISLLV